MRKKKELKPELLYVLHKNYYWKLYIFIFKILQDRLNVYIDKDNEWSNVIDWMSIPDLKQSQSINLSHDFDKCGTFLSLLRYLILYLAGTSLHSLLNIRMKEYANKDKFIQLVSEVSRIATWTTHLCLIRLPSYIHICIYVWDRHIWSGYDCMWSRS